MNGRDDKYKKNLQSESQGKRTHGMSRHKYGNIKMNLKKRYRGV
jgi:hypothetical protein